MGVIYRCSTCGRTSTKDRDFCGCQAQWKIMTIYFVIFLPIVLIFGVGGGILLHYLGVHG